MLIPGKHWINSFISRNRGCPGTVLEFRLNVYRTHGSRLSVYILRFQHYLTFGIRLHSGTFPSPGPPLQVQVMCLWIAVMLTFLKCSDTFYFSSPSLMFNERICRQKAGTKTDFLYRASNVWLSYTQHAEKAGPIWGDGSTLSLCQDLFCMTCCLQWLASYPVHHKVIWIQKIEAETFLKCSILQLV